MSVFYPQRLMKPSEAAKNEVLHRVKRRGMVNSDTPCFFKEFSKAVGHRLFGILLDFNSAAFFGSLK
jgi:hypothetical protein